MTEPTGTTQPTPSSPITLSGSGSDELAGVSLTGELTVEDDTFRITYTLTNDSDQTMVAIDAVPPFRERGSFSPKQTAAWVTVSREGIVNVGKLTLLPRGDTGPLTRIYVVPVEPGTSIDSLVELDWPLQAQRPYTPPEPLADPVERLRLCVTVGPLTPTLDAAPVVERPRGPVTNEGTRWLDFVMEDMLANQVCTDPVPIG